jgi:hypothetical protein
MIAGGCDAAPDRAGRRHTGQEKHMPRKQPGLRAFVTIAGIAGTMLAGGSTASQASVARPETFPYPTPCYQTSTSCSYNSGWNTYGDGSCEAETIATWSGLPANVLDVTIETRSSYPFASCTSYTTVYFGMAPPLQVILGPYWGFACATLDPTCSSTQTYTYQTSNAVPAADLPAIEDLYMISSKNS